MAQRGPELTQRVLREVYAAGARYRAWNSNPPLSCVHLHSRGSLLAGRIRSNVLSVLDRYGAVTSWFDLDVLDDEWRRGYMAEI